jgi:hypothetical protein
MHHLIANRRSPAVAAAIALLLAGVLLAACGSSSSSGSTSPSNPSASTSAATTGAPSEAPSAPNGSGGTAAGGRFAGLRECLRKNGITLPKRTPGQGGPGAGGGLLGGGGTGRRQLPAGVSREQLEAAIKKCGGTPGARLGTGARFSTPAAKAALTKFAACMRENGQNVAPPNTSGKGPVFSTSGLNTTSAAFKAAQGKCMSLLSGLFARPNGAAPPAAG